MQYNNKFDKILERMSMMFPSIYKNIVDWYPSGRTEIVVILSDGSKMAYEMFDDTIRTIRSRTIDEDDWRKKFSDALRYQMMRSGIMQNELAERTGISIQMISKYLNCRATPNTYNISKIADVLDCPISRLTDYDI